MSAKKTIATWVAIVAELAKRGDVVYGDGLMTIADGKVINYCAERFESLRAEMRKHASA